MTRYIGLDVHAASTTVAVIGPSGKRIGSSVVETNGAALIAALKQIPGPRLVCLEEGTQAEWLFQVLKPHADDIAVIQPEGSRGQKSDLRDAFGLADIIRTGKGGTRVFKDIGKLAKLRELSRVYSMLRDDVVRTKNRIKGLFRSGGVATSTDVFSEKNRVTMLSALSSAKRHVAEALYDELDKQLELKEQLQDDMIEESRRHPDAKVIARCPGFGPVRAAQILAIVVTPHRFRTRRQFWAFCGFGIVMRSSSDWVKAPAGGWTRANVQQTRGLNLNHNHQAKNILKGAAVTVIAQHDTPLARDYQRLLANGTKPNLARLTIARRIAAILLSVWKSGEEYDPARHRKQDNVP